MKLTRRPLKHQRWSSRDIFSWGDSEEAKKHDRDQLSLEEITNLTEMEKAIENEDHKEYRFKSWHALLQSPARAAWRTSNESPPAQWFTKRSEILENSQRTNKQLRASLNKIMDTQNTLIERRQEERIRQKKMSNRNRPKESLAEKNQSEKDALSSSVFYKPEFTFASLQHRLLPNYAIVKRVLLEANSLLPDFQPKRILDFGVGVGSSSAAAMDIFEGLEWVHGIDPSKSMRDCALLVLDGNGPRVTTDSMLSTKSVKGNFDLILFNFTATELPHVAATLAAAALMWEKLSPNGVFVMIEPGTPDGFNNIKSVRSMLLDCCPPNEEEDESMDLLDQCHIIAPCTHNCTCPVGQHKRTILRPSIDNEFDEDDFREDELNEDETLIEVKEIVSKQVKLGGMTETDSFNTSFCSFVHNIPGSENSQRGDKLSYLVAQKRYADLEVNSSPRFPNLVELLAETYRTRHDIDETNHKILLDTARQNQIKFENLKEHDPYGLSILVGDENRQSFGRIIRAPIKKKGHVIVDYCASGLEGMGKIVRQRIGKSSSGKVAPGQYLAARKARW
eukprot:CAMPEP_0194214718 /NCGR_PEP_ID=MMETSP0156-20130528/16056_1 /TAXON_ID=33649 /ORGANISM="Thalassionema nitzschioides, Strain L26-B" /LENGTH=562 /DNA_ID=CAMNT_0038943045 /DNA_START=118 /DNA_END=1803 /DNA_ORIENTATION=+